MLLPAPLNAAGGAAGWAVSRVAAVLVAAAILNALLAAPPAAQAAAHRTDQTFKTFTGSTYTSRYHLYAGRLDWSRPVGLIMYADGSGEYGLKNPRSPYLLAGKDGLVRVAKRHNMVLLTPFAPNTRCSDGGGSCWYVGDPVGYARWSRQLVTWVLDRYPIDRRRVAIGGYSSGAQWATEYFAPIGGAQRIQRDGVIVAISYGGSPKTPPVDFRRGWKSRVQMRWDVGSEDWAYRTGSSYGVKAGYRWYTKRGFDTSLRVVPGLGHSRGGQFGRIMDAAIKTGVPR